MIFGIDTFESYYQDTFTEYNYISASQCLSNNYSNSTIKAELKNDAVLSILSRQLSSISDLSALSGSLYNITENINGVTQNLSVRSSSIFKQLYGFNVQKYPTYSGDGIYSSDSIPKDLSSISVMYMDALDSPPAINVDIKNVNANYLLLPETQFSLSNIFQSGKIMQYDDIRQLFERLAVFLQNLKVLRYNLYFKVTRFASIMKILECVRTYPELPVNTTKYKDICYNYGAVLVSPYSKHYDVIQYDIKSDGQITDYAFPTGQLVCVATSNTDVKCNSLVEQDLIYTYDTTSDFPTFDVMSKDGSNGEFTIFRNITTETYDIYSKIDSIYSIFNIKPNTIISSKTIKAAISYIFSIWMLNIKTYQCDYYACHYNCHGNNLDGIHDESSKRDRFIYSITYILDSSSFPEVYRNDVAINNDKKYITYIGDGITTMEVDYPKYFGTSDLLYGITVSAYMQVESHNNNTIYTYYLDDSKYLKKIGTFNDNNTEILSVYDVDGASGSSVKYDRLSCLGDLSVIFKYCDNVKKQIPIYNALVDNIPDGKIYYDQRTSYNYDDLTSMIDIGKRGIQLSDINNAYEPKVPITVFWNGTMYELPTSCLNYTYVGNNVADSDINKYRTATVRIEVNPSLPDDDIHSIFFGSITKEFKVYNNTKLDMSTIDIAYNNLTGIPEVDYNSAGYTKDQIRSFLPFYVKENSNDVLTDFWTYDIDNGQIPGKHCITISPTLHQDNMYGESYYYGQKQLEFIIKDQDGDETPSPSLLEYILTYNLAADWNDNDKNKNCATHDMKRYTSVEQGVVYVSYTIKTKEYYSELDPQHLINLGLKSIVGIINFKKDYLDPNSGQTSKVQLASIPYALNKEDDKEKEDGKYLEYVGDIFLQIGEITNIYIEHIVYGAGQNYQRTAVLNFYYIKNYDFDKSNNFTTTIATSACNTSKTADMVAFIGDTIIVTNIVSKITKKVVGTNQYSVTYTSTASFGTSIVTIKGIKPSKGTMTISVPVKYNFATATITSNLNLTPAKGTTPEAKDAVTLTLHTASGDIHLTNGTDFIVSTRPSSYNKLGTVNWKFKSKKSTYFIANQEKIITVTVI